ncbi:MULTISPECIES: cobalt-precorrin-8 methylmutase [Aerococcus]|uniref:cobalt-precorrin-8 methylmutase n=1 Tax=Aerococcus TaxID=1375 RepID=UPI0018A6DB39|nr:MULTISPECIES: cobalt-precorrin-8 methylmutase [Aerococcus]MCY3035436.1 cobalt-precorrin-8 methylmutase [Aerococcus sp. Group 2]MCY3038858.1 cobalt-precorrin-8 methylmutase [Aerococcus sp. Group 2]MCY3041013.1 cobalt-precorrin-8 methylmutase [Aerococcus sp. Group 2]MCY3042251.1 cobalt-precorrin-8 methylmutase [Aerococcus sp. Group 2]MDK6520428.1 cobalt-precorrin-8 methylmutase [Aerococcus urinae]
MAYIKKPERITDRSFEIIDAEIKRDFPDFQFQNDLEERIIKRAIHTSADFDYLHNLVFDRQGAQVVQEVIRSGGHLITDTTMAQSGINKRILKELGTETHCFIRDPRTYQIAKDKGITRSMAAIELAAQLEGPKVFVVGNAPTAIYKILEMIDAGRLQAEAVVGVPVGFVGAAESKQALHDYPIPSIAALGRKGGSNVAAAIINAIQYDIKDTIYQN